MKGQVSKISTQEGMSKRGKWTRYSFITTDENGTESGWVTYGFDEPPFKEGEWIEYETVEENGYKSFKKGSGRILRGHTARHSQQPGDTSQSGGPGGRSPTGDSVATSGADRQAQIVLQHSQEMAISAVGLLLAHEALPVTGAKTKAGEAKRFEELIAAVDKLTVKFYNDVISGRLLTTVADMGVVDTRPDGNLPPPSQPSPSNTSKAQEY